MPVTAEKCRRWGCHRTVDEGVQCGQCHSWYHPKCSGLSIAQYDEIHKPEREFKCMICITNFHPDLHNTSQPSHAPNIQTGPPTPPKPPISSTSTVEVIDDRLSSSKSTLQCLAGGITSLNARVSELDSSIRKSPLSQAGAKVLQLSRHEIENAAAAQADADTRAKKLLLRGLPFTHENPIDIASRILSPLSAIHPQLKITSAS